MCCLFTILVLLGARAIDIVWWIAQPGALGRRLQLRALAHPRYHLRAVDHDDVGDCRARRCERDRLALGRARHLRRRRLLGRRGVPATATACRVRHDGCDPVRSTTQNGEPMNDEVTDELGPIDYLVVEFPGRAGRLLRRDGGEADGTGRGGHGARPRPADHHQGRGRRGRRL